jgi:hypothetical protein
MSELYRLLLVLSIAVTFIVIVSSSSRTSYSSLSSTGRHRGQPSMNGINEEDYNGGELSNNNENDDGDDDYSYGSREVMTSGGIRRRPSASGDILRRMSGGHLTEAAKRSGRVDRAGIGNTMSPAGWVPSLCGQWDDWCTPGSNKPGLSCCEGYTCKCKFLWNSNCRCRSRIFKGR